MTIRKRTKNDLQDTTQEIGQNFFFIHVQMKNASNLPAYPTLGVLPDVYNDVINIILVDIFKISEKTS